MNVKDLVAIDVHTHAEVSCRQPQDEVWQEYEAAASKYFKAAASGPRSPRPSPTTASARSGS